MQVVCVVIFPIFISAQALWPYTDGTQIQDAGGVVAITSYG